MDWSDDSQADIFASQVKVKKKKKTFVPSSAPQPLRLPKYSDLVFFKWGENGERPFQIMRVSDLQEGDLDEKWLTSFLSPNSRTIQRELATFQGFKVCIFAKIGEGMLK